MMKTVNINYSSNKTLDKLKYSYTYTHAYYIPSIHNEIERKGVDVRIAWLIRLLSKAYLWR